MWESEARQLSADDLRTIAELVSEKFGLDADQAAQLRAKVTSYAGFRPRGGRHQSQANFAFEHEVYFDYFLGSSIQRLLCESQLDELVRFFDRGVIPQSVLAAAARALIGAEPLHSSLLRCSTGIAFENRRRNLGSLVLAYAREVQPLQNSTVQGLCFIDVISGPARFNSVVFGDCQFISADLRNAVFEECDAETSSFDGIKLNSASKMDIGGLHPGTNIRILHDEPNGEVYAPSAIADVLERHGAPVDDGKPEAPQYSEKAQDLIKLLERAARAYNRSKILYEGDHQHPSLLGSPLWPDLKRLLIKHDVISEELRESRGANVPGYRLRVNVDELLAGQSGENLPQSSTSGLWQDFRSM